MPGKPAAGKLYIKTHGCQMNEYDSAKMADVLAAEHGLELTQDETDADVILVNTCSIREKAQEKVFSQLGRWRELKNARGGAVLIGVGGCVASQEGEAIIKRAPFVDLVFGPQTLHRLPQLIDARRATGLPQVDISLPEIEKFDKPAGAARRRPYRLRLDHGGLQQVLLVLRGALYPRRRNLASVRRRDPGSGATGRTGRARSQSAGPERQRVSRPDA
jgi:tRNA A37 methylthiotransferase MiaB